METDGERESGAVIVADGETGLMARPGPEDGELADATARFMKIGMTIRHGERRKLGGELSRASSRADIYERGVQPVWTGVTDNMRISSRF